MSNDKQVPRIKEGPRIYIESLLTAQEYKDCAKKYPNTYNTTFPAAYFKSEMDWRYRMGAQMTEAEIETLNDNLEVLKQVLRKLAEEEALEKVAIEWIEIDI